MTNQAVHTCSLAHSQRLKELGVTQDSLFFWDKSPAEYIVNEKGESEIKHYKTGLVLPPYYDLTQSIDYWSAFNSDELLRKIPKKIFHQEQYYYFTVHLIEVYSAEETFWDYEISYYQKSIQMFAVRHRKLVDALAGILIFLLENDLYQLESFEVFTAHDT